MQKLAGYISLNSVVADFLGESEQGSHQFFKLWNIAYRGLENLGLDFFYQIRTVKLLVNANLTVNIPSDFANWTKIGVLNGRGEIIPLYHNPKLTTLADLSVDRLTDTQDNALTDLTNWGLNTWCNYWNGGGYVNIYGVPSGAPFVGSFKVDLDNGVIVLNEEFQYDYVVLEYVATPKEGEEYYLPVQFREALISWIVWKSNRSLPSRSMKRNASNRENSHDYYNDRRNAIAAWRPTRQQEIYQASQEQTRLSVKS